LGVASAGGGARGKVAGCVIPKSSLIFDCAGESAVCCSTDNISLALV